jgi:hypothetical protein
MLYKIAVSNIALNGKIPAGDKRWGTFNDSFQNLELEPIDIANAIYTGRSITTWHTGRRSLENFVLGQHIAVDMDSGDSRSTFDTLMKNEFVQMYASMIYTTPSHTPQAPRSRILFLLDNTIENKDAYQQAAKFVCSLFDGCDTACTDASRFFYGSLNCDIQLVGKFLPLSHLRMHYRRLSKTVAKASIPVVQPIKTIAKPSKPMAEVKPEKLLEWAINDAASEGRNKRAFRLGKQLKDVGYTYTEALPIIEMYQQRVETMKSEPFSQKEAMRTLESAYSH